MRKDDTFLFIEAREHMDYYEQIFKRKSFHLFKGSMPLTDVEIRELEDFVNNVKPLYPGIKTEIIG